MYFYISLELVSSSQSLNLPNYKIRNTVPLTLSLSRVILIDFTLSNARRFYSSMGNPTGVKGLTLFLQDNVSPRDLIME